METLRIVVVEDEYYVRKGIIGTFDWAKLGCEIVGEAGNGREGISVIMEQRPDLIIADIEMPVTDGIEMMKMLREKQCRSEVIFLTAYQKFTYIHGALKLEAVDYLLKPFHYDDLKECINKVRIRLHKMDEETMKTALLTQAEIQVQNRYVKKAVSYVREHYAGAITITGVAEWLNLSEAYFCRLFKKESGYTFGQYVTNYRIHVAAGLLTNFPLKVNEVAAQVGFIDSNYFSITFKKIMEMSPSEYQELKRVY